MPGQPRGNVENNRCMSKRLLGPRISRYRPARKPRIVLFGYAVPAATDRADGIVRTRHGRAPLFGDVGAHGLRVSLSAAFARSMS